MFYFETRRDVVVSPQNYVVNNAKIKAMPHMMQPVLGVVPQSFAKLLWDLAYFRLEKLLIDVGHDDCDQHNIPIIQQDMSLHQQVYLMVQTVLALTLDSSKLPKQLDFKSRDETTVPLLKFLRCKDPLLDNKFSDAMIVYMFEKELMEQVELELDIARDEFCRDDDADGNAMDYTLEELQKFTDYITNTLDKRCSNCRKTLRVAGAAAASDGNTCDSLKRCSRCHDTMYCSAECQRQHWAGREGRPPHSTVCKQQTPKERETALQALIQRMQSRGKRKALNAENEKNQNIYVKATQRDFETSHCFSWRRQILAVLRIFGTLPPQLTVPPIWCCDRQKWHRCCQILMDFGCCLRLSLPERVNSFYLDEPENKKAARNYLRKMYDEKEESMLDDLTKEFIVLNSTFDDVWQPQVGSYLLYCIVYVLSENTLREKLDWLLKIPFFSMWFDCMISDLQITQEQRKEAISMYTQNTPVSQASYPQVVEVLLRLSSLERRYQAIIEAYNQVYDKDHSLQKIKIFEIDLARLSAKESRQKQLQNACRHCEYCGEMETQPGQFKKCSQCKNAVYCNAECAKNGWKRHKIVCNITATMAKQHESSYSSSSK